MGICESTDTQPSCCRSVSSKANSKPSSFLKKFHEAKPPCANPADISSYLFDSKFLLKRRSDNPGISPIVLINPPAPDDLPTLYIEKQEAEIFVKKISSCQIQLDMKPELQDMNIPLDETNLIPNSFRLQGPRKTVFKSITSPMENSDTQVNKKLSGMGTDSDRPVEVIGNISNLNSMQSNSQPAEPLGAKTGRKSLLFRVATQN